MNEEDIKNIFNQFPLFIPEIANSLEKKDWLNFDQQLENLLLVFSQNKEDLKAFPFLEIIKKDDAYFPIEISKKEWDDFGLTIIAKQLINFLNGKELLDIFSNLNYQELKLLFNRILDLIPEKNYEEKLLWLEENKPSFYNIFLTLPINPFINDLIKQNYLKISEEELKRHFDNLNETLKFQLLNYQNAEENLNFATKNLFSQEKIIKLTYLSGQILLGFLKPNLIEQEIKKIFELQENDELILKIKNYLINNYFILNEEEIKKLYIITSDILVQKKEITEEKEIEIPISKNENQEEIKTFEKLDLTELINKEEKPIIINEEKNQKEISQINENKTLEKGKKIKNIFSTFKLFNKFNEQIKPEIKAKIEQPKKIVSYSENKSNLEIKNDSNLEEIFIKTNIKNEKITENNNNIINLKEIKE